MVLAIFDGLETWYNWPVRSRWFLCFGSLSAIALCDAHLHGTLRDSSLRVPVQGDCRERCEARFPKLSWLLRFQSLSPVIRPSNWSRSEALWCRTV